MTIGRIVSTPIMPFEDPSRMIGAYAVINCALLAVGIFHPGMTGAWAILLTSFFMSIVFPTIFAMGFKGLGEDTKIAGSFLVMAILGVVIFPPLLGWIARQTGTLALGYALPAAGYVVVALSAFSVPALNALNDHQT